MIPLRGADVAAALGVAAPREAAEAEVLGLTMDSRAVRAGDLFLARRGARHDGRLFAADALAAGAALVVGETGTPPGPRTLVVPDGLAALARIAALVRARFKGPVVAVGGSVGKTTTKDLLAGLLGASRRVVASEKSFNNHAGVPLTLCRLEPDTEAAVVEIGTNHPGELAPLAALAEPTAAVITAVGAEHLEGFGDLAGVLKEELSLADALPPGATLYVNGDDAPLADAAYPAHLRVVRCGFGPRADVRATAVERADGAPAFRLDADGPVIAAPAFPFGFARSNLLLAAVVARDLGASASDLARTAATLKPAALRGEVRRCGEAVVWVDCYNANPLSAGAALAELARVGGRRAAVLGDMLELGPAAPALHEELGRSAAAAGVADAVFVGSFGEAFRRGFGAGRLVLRRDAGEAVEDFRRLVATPGVVLLKASRGVALERVLEVCR